MRSWCIIISFLAFATMLNAMESKENRALSSQPSDGISQEDVQSKKDTITSLLKHPVIQGNPEARKLYKEYAQELFSREEALRLKQSMLYQAIDELHTSISTKIKEIEGCIQNCAKPSNNQSEEIT